jgi:hypothetical protein
VDCQDSKGPILSISEWLGGYLLIHSCHLVLSKRHPIHLSLDLDPHQSLHWRLPHAPSHLTLQHTYQGAGTLHRNLSRPSLPFQDHRLSIKTDLMSPTHHCHPGNIRTAIPSHLISVKLPPEKTATRHKFKVGVFTLNIYERTPKGKEHTWKLTGLAWRK